MIAGAWVDAARALVGAMPPTALVGVLADAAWRLLSDRPFAALEPAADERERASRAQVAPVVALFRALLRRVPPDTALRLTATVVDAGALGHLARTLPELTDARTRRVLHAGDPATIQADGRRMLARFFTATADVVSAGPDHFAFTVTACALHRLVTAVGHPELAPLFCNADARFFAEHGMTLERPTTLASGGTTCPFTIRRAPDLAHTARPS